MNVQSTAAKERSKIFEQVATEQGFTVIRGRFGGEFNNDQLAIRSQANYTHLLLGLQVTDASGEVQLDTLSMGPHRQFTRKWIRAVCYALRLDPTQSAHATAIEGALADGTLVPAALVLTRPDANIGILRIALPDEPPGFA